MTTTTLSSRCRFQNLLLDMLKKNLSIGVYLTAILFFFFPLQLLLNTLHLSARMAREGADFTNYSGTALGIYTDVALLAVAILMVLAPIVIGLMQCSFLHSKRAVDLYHSLPVTRSQLLSANLLAAFLTVTVPFLLNYILNLFVVLYRHSALGAVAEKVAFSPICWDLFGWLAMVFAILAIIMVVATQVGSVFENFVFSCELLCAPPLIILINDTLCQLFLTGYVTPWTPKFLAASTPVGVMIGRYEGGTTALFYNWASVIWLLLGAALFVGALILYRRRKSELAETPGCRGVVGTVLTALAVYIGGITLGGMLWSIASENRSEWVFLFWVAVGAVLVYLLVAAILNRGFGGLRKTLPKGAALCVLVLLSALAITSGGLGYESRRPATASVESVTIPYRGWYDYVTELDAANPESHLAAGQPELIRYSLSPLQKVVLTSPQAIQQLGRIHQQLQSEKETLYSSNWEITYRLKSGKLLRRYSDHGPAAQALIEELMELPEFQQQTNPLLRLNPQSVERIGLYDSLGFSVDTLESPADRSAVLEALHQDALANGTRDFTANSPVLGYIYLDTGKLEPYQELPQPLTENHIVSFSLPVFASYTHLTAVLQRLGKAEMLQPVDITAVTAIGLDDYYKSYQDGDHLVATVAAKDYSAYNQQHLAEVPAEAATLQQLLAEVPRFATLGSENARWDIFYLTLYKGQERGLTLMQHIAKLPASLASHLPPDVQERYLSTPRVPLDGRAL